LGRSGEGSSGKRESCSGHKTGDSLGTGNHSLFLSVGRWIAKQLKHVCNEKVFLPI
jgi:hypothetical protein